MHLKQALYSHYRTKFKGSVTDESLLFGAEKLRPVLQPWVADLDLRGPVIDLGCGAGELLLTLSHLGFTDLSGCDVSAEQVAIASLKFPAIKECDLLDFLLSKDDNSIELITIFDVLEHFTRQETFEIVSLIYKKLRPGGRIIAHLPNGLSPFVGHVFWEDITHEWCMTPKSAETLCRLCSFRRFEAKEHLGSSNMIKGKIRHAAWSVIRMGMQTLNKIETGSAGGSIWTRNFAFKADK